MNDDSPLQPENPSPAALEAKEETLGANEISPPSATGETISLDKSENSLPSATGETISLEKAIPASPPPPGPESPPSLTYNDILLWSTVGCLGTFLLIFVVSLIFLLISLPQMTQSGPLSMPQAEQIEKIPPPEAPQPLDLPKLSSLLLLEDDFSKSSARWDQSQSVVKDGAYEMQVETPNHDTYGLFLGNGNVADFALTVDLQQIAGDPTAEFGIRFRQSGPEDYLMVSLSGTGYYRLVRVTNAVYKSLVPWTFDSHIKRGLKVVNSLQVTAQGQTITAAINGQEVLKSQDSEGKRGQLAFGLLTFAQGGLVVRFDNLKGSIERQRIQEDFNNPKTVPWSVGGATIKDGAYELFTGAGVQSWQQPLPSQSSKVTNFDLKVDLTFLSGPRDAALGVMFGDAGNFKFHRLDLLPVGGLALSYFNGKESRFLLRPTLVKAVETGEGKTNHLRIAVQGKEIHLWINGKELPTIESPFLTTGTVGMIIVSGQAGEIKARFDNFQLREILGDDENT